MAERTVTTTATGRVRSEPDNARITTEVRGKADSASDARTTAEDRTASLVDALVTSGIDESSIRRVNVRLGENSGTFDEDPEFDYEAVSMLVVRCGLESAETAVVTAVDAGASVTGIEYGFADERREQLHARALADAVKKSRTRAEAIADASGGELDGVQTVTTIEEVIDGMQNLVDEALRFDTRLELDPGHISVEARVEVCYRLAT